MIGGRGYAYSRFDAEDVNALAWSSSCSPMVDAAVLALLLLLGLVSQESESEDEDEDGDCAASPPI